METATETPHAEQSARSALASIRSMVARMEHVRDCNGEDCELDDATINEGLNLYSGSTVDEEARAEYHDEEAARTAIEEDALSIEVRSGWHTPGGEADDEEYCITLFTGGPAGRIIGNLSSYGEPETAHIEYQDWFTPWERLDIRGEDEAALLTYASVFYFGH